MRGVLSRRDALVLGAGLIPYRMGGAAVLQANPVRVPHEVRIAIIGLEGHYSEILEVARTSEQVRVSAIAEADPDLLQRASRNNLLRGAKPYADYRRMLREEKLDIVAVCGQNGSRAAIVQECAERKLAIVAEKPLAMDLQELARVRDKIDSNKVPFTMLLPMRFYPVYQMMRRIVSEGRIGDVVSLAAQKSYKLGDRPAWMKARKTYGGTIPYIGIHMVDLMLWTSGRDFTEVAAFQSNIGIGGYGEMETNAAAVFRMDNKGTASIRLDYLRPDAAPTHGDDRLRIAGNKGIIEYQDGRDLMIVTASEKPAPVKDLPLPRLLFADFLESVFNHQKHWISPVEIYRVNEIVLKAREAAESAKLVRL